MTTRGAAIVETIRAALDRLEHLPLDEQEAIYSALVRDLASRRPECVASMAHQWQPTEPERDPRGAL